MRGLDIPPLIGKPNILHVLIRLVIDNSATMCAFSDLPEWQGHGVGIYNARTYRFTGQTLA